MIEGAGRLRILFTLIAPVLKPGIVSVGMFSFLGAWNHLFFILIIRHPVQVPEGDMHEPAGIIEAAFQNEAVEMRIPWGRPARKNSPLV